MKYAVICFTERGAWVCRRLFHKLKETGEECEAIIPKRFLREEWKKEGLKEREEEFLSQWTGKMFAEKRAMIFVSATGIAVRAIAPWIRDKMTDPPVVTVDEGAQFVIPLLSGHVGGANELARHIADWLEAVPVITTATDVNGKFAVDLFASAYHMTIIDRKEAKNISAAVLEGKQIGVFSDLPIKKLPDGFVMDRWCEENICITVKDPSFPEKKASYLRLVPRAVVLGVGCRRGTDPEFMKEKVFALLKEHGIDPAAVKAIASVDVKQDEPAVLGLKQVFDGECLHQPCEQRFYTPEQLNQVPGDFKESAFVKKQIGVGNVCERSACAAGGKLLVEKQAGDGITLAAALEWQGELDFSKGFGTTVRGKECLWDRNTQFYILKKI
ncbi:precorrin-4 C(11)-methyltransferase [Clostridium sp. AM51-4]|jgi:cobalt-precorrin 5A hydrolase|nr:MULTISPECIES: cobalt-precorrin 5A hydrolase [unclassified Clostridium]RHQ08370.1 precorrin-4 C(11)-methyltransferase [Clostridium sp. AM51-4]RHU40506.1 precorrin-4 C(11)-methyltransferase [Clostridium sp. TM06-18]